MYRSTNAILKKKLKQLRREDEVILSLPLLDPHTAGQQGRFQCCLAVTWVEFWLWQQDYVHVFGPCNHGG